MLPVCVEGAVGIRSRNRDLHSKKRLVLHSFLHVHHGSVFTMGVTSSFGESGSLTK